VGSILFFFGEINFHFVKKKGALERHGQRLFFGKNFKKFARFLGKESYGIIKKIGRF
jgi:hypothetical protein